MTFTTLPLTLRQLQYALAVEQTGGFRRAATLCGVSQPSLSAQVALLEDALDVRLFERSRRGVLVTREGAELLARFQTVLGAAQDAVVAAEGLGDPLHGTIRIGVIPTVAPYLLPRLTGKLPEGLRVEWFERKTDDLVLDLRAGRLDGGLLALEAELGPVASEPIARDPFVLAMAKDHPLARTRRRIEQHRLLELKVLLLDDGHCLRDQALEVCGTGGDETFRATSLATLVPMVAEGHGVTVLPTLALPVENRRGRLHIREFRAPTPGRTIGMIWREGSPREPAVRAVSSAARRATSPELRC